MFCLLCFVVRIPPVSQMSDIKGMFSFSSGATAWPELNWVVTDSLAAATEADDDSGRFAPPGPADVAFLQFTSGMDGGEAMR